MILTARERQILAGVARGQSNKLIARELGIAPQTVKIHLQNIRRKTGPTNRVQLARLGWEAAA